MIISIDHGNFDIKTYDYSFMAGITEHTVKPPMTDEVLEYEGKYWTLSSKRINYMRDKTNDERYFMLTLIAIAIDMERKGKYTPFEHVQLAVGLPPEHYGVLKDKFAKYFKKDGIIHFVYKNVPYSIVVDQVLVFPQAYAAVVSQSSRIVKMPTVFIVDIGGFTTDVLLLRYGKLDFQFCRSLESGIITMNNEIIRKVGVYHNILIDDQHIKSVLQGEETILDDEVIDTIRNATEMHTNDILNQLRELQVDLRSNPSVFVGGGSILLRPFIERTSLVKKPEFVMNPNANAIGYDLLAQAQLSARAKG